MPVSIHWKRHVCFCLPGSTSAKERDDSSAQVRPFLEPPPGVSEPVLQGQCGQELLGLLVVAHTREGRDLEALKPCDMM